jgi:Protein of unknown function (DUF3152)
MPSPRVSDPAASWRRFLLAATVILGLLATGALALDRLAGADSNAAGPIPVPSAQPPLAAVFPAPSQSPAAKAPAAVLSMPGEFPTEGPGEFRFAPGEGRELGEAGSLWRFRVAVEDGIDEDLDEFAEFVDATLGHRQSWTAGGQLRLQRVPGGADHDFTIVLVTSATAGRLCATAGLAVVGGGLPEGGVSCRTAGRVVLNLSRWRLSVPHYVEGGVPLEVYRQMLVNHEVGHELGYGHEDCPEQGQPAPVMQQQTLSLDGCEANPWPYLDGERYAGPRVP